MACKLFEQRHINTSLVLTRKCHIENLLMKKVLTDAEGVFCILAGNIYTCLVSAYEVLKIMHVKFMCIKVYEVYKVSIL